MLPAVRSGCSIISVRWSGCNPSARTPPVIVLRVVSLPATNNNMQ
ncbi:MAG: hypothetical protein ABWY80_06040 [Acidimicrobiia bacterium]